MSLPEMPHDLLAERSLVASLLIDGQSFDSISALKLTPEDFYDPKLGIVFSAIYELAVDSVAVDFVSVSSKLSDWGKIDQIGGQEYLVDLVEDHISSANAFYYGKTIKEKSQMRKIIRTAREVVEQGLSFQGNTSDFISDVESRFFKLTSETRTGGLTDLKSVLKVNLKDLEDTKRSKGEISGLPTGFTDLDRALLGLQPGQLVILAARPGVGKTSFALSLAVNSVKQTGLAAAIFSLEMLAPELSMRILSGQAGVDSQRLRTKNYLDSDLRNIARSVRELSQLKVFINDSADINIVDIKSQCRKLKSEHGLGIVMIDYLQLMQGSSKTTSREQQISEISRGLKNLAKELECPVLALSQLNRAVESRPDKRPLISDLRESGSIEQDADIVLMIYRDELYNPETKEKGIAELNVAKNRAGGRGTVKLSWIGSQTRFANLEQRAQSDGANPGPPPGP